MTRLQLPPIRLIKQAKASSSCSLELIEKQLARTDISEDTRKYLENLKQKRYGG